MSFIDYDRLESLDAAAYQGQDPYPWVNPQGILTPEAFEELRASLPDVGMFTKQFGVPRRAGQAPHDRFTLEYTRDTPVEAPWKAFLKELSGRRYRKNLCRLLGVRDLEFNYHWHYTPNGCSVSPHCDAKRKLGSHIFYFNTEEDWDPSWGGETVVLDDGGRFDLNSAPDFDDFDRAMVSETLGNRSFIFSRQGNSWHGVREIDCPPGYLRKVFIVVLNRTDAWRRLKQRVRGTKFERF
jgi:hypothetical protein